MFEVGDIVERTGPTQYGVTQGQSYIVVKVLKHDDTIGITDLNGNQMKGCSSYNVKYFSLAKTPFKIKEFFSNELFTI